MKKPTTTVSTVRLHATRRRGPAAWRIALTGVTGSGKSTLFRAVQSTATTSGELAGTHARYETCRVDVGLDQACVIDLPSIRSLHEPGLTTHSSLAFLLWGNERPLVAAHEAMGPPAPFAPPDVIVQVFDATALERNFELTLELLELGRPLIIALNRMDEARNRSMHIATRAIAVRLGVPVIPVVATMGHGIAALFSAAVEAARKGAYPLAPTPGPHLKPALAPLMEVLRKPDVVAAFRVPLSFLAARIAAHDEYFSAELAAHFPDITAGIDAARDRATARCARPIGEELHADRHHLAAMLAEAALRPGGVRERRDWRWWADELFLNPRLGIVGSLLVFALVLFVVFDVSAWLDSMTSMKLAAALSSWEPNGTTEVVLRAMADGMVGLIGIVIPYMLPLVLLLVVLEQVGIMARIAFAIDRGFHRLGLHGDIAVPFLLGLGCNIPALAAIRDSTKGGERFIASVLVTFVPCSARSAIVLALAGKYLGVWGVIGVFATPMLVIAVLGRLIRRRAAEAPGQIVEIPPYAWPRLKPLLRETWLRTQDIVTIVTPLLIGGSVVLALLHHVDADAAINLALSPITHWWLGLPIVLGVPLLFGVLRKELSLTMVFQALGGVEIDRLLGPGQILTFLLFVMLYVPCISTVAAMTRTIGRRAAMQAMGLTVVVAMVVGGAARVGASLLGM